MEVFSGQQEAEVSGNQPTTGVAFTFAAAGLIHGTLANARVADAAQLAVRGGILVMPRGPGIRSAVIPRPRWMPPCIARRQ